MKCPAGNINCQLCSGAFDAANLTPQQNGGFPAEHCEQVKHAERAQHNLHDMIIEQNPERRSERRLVTRSSTLELAKAHLMHHTMIDSDIFDEIVQQTNQALDKQIAEKESQKQRKPTTSLDWELTQALIHLQNAISVTDSHRAHLLQSALIITKGVRES